MRTPRFLIGTAAAAVALLGVVGATGSQAALASMAVPTPTIDTAPAAPAAGLAPLQEFKTPGGGWFYTLNAGEANNAIAKFKFTKSADIGKLYSSPRPGTVAIHRLRAKSPLPSYMLSISPAEFNSPNFTDEGILGYADGSPRPGAVKLVRFSNHGKWRVLPDRPTEVNNMTAAGYAVDGQVGWIQP